MRPGNATVVARRLHELLAETRTAASEEMRKPAADLTGRWEVTLSFFTSESTHTFFLEQEGNWINGTHQADFSTQEVIGMIEGNEVKLRSTHRAVGDRIGYWFSGMVEGDSMEGSVFLGEYLTAKFSARRLKYRHNHEKIEVPGGPPLAT
jgi:hypothetical protein